MASPVSAEEGRPPNVLFIAVDDLRPQLGCYGYEWMVTPNIDQLAAEGVRFDRAYCMVPTCGASRASMMTGLRPSRNRFVTFQARADMDAPGIPTLNRHFKDHGYYTVSNGKVFHVLNDSADGWSEPPWRPSGAVRFALPENQQIHERQKAEVRRAPGPAYEAADVPDDTYIDGQLAKRTVQDLRRLQELDQPFFLAVGFFKPHLPFVAPTRYWDLYDDDVVSLPDNYHPPQDAPQQAIHNWMELRAYAGIPQEGPLPDELARTLIHGYYACVSYIDAQIGKVLGELEDLGLADDTIVVLWSDHGWNLGEHTLWCKHSCFEVSMWIPLIVKAPGIEGDSSTDGLTESIDIYPSLCELAGLPLPDHLEGKSFVPLLRQPDREWKESAIGRFRSGDTIRTDRYRFTEYTNPAGRRVATMLYDHDVDPDETVNISKRTENRRLVEELTARLHAGMGRDDESSTVDQQRDSGALHADEVPLSDVYGTADGWGWPWLVAGGMLVLGVLFIMVRPLLGTSGNAVRKNEG